MFRSDLNNERIRKIIVGELHEDNFTISVGQVWNFGEGKKRKISRIVRDENSYFIFNEVIYIIYVEVPEKGEVIWRYITGHKVIVELFI